MTDDQTRRADPTHAATETTDPGVPIRSDRRLRTPGFADRDSVWTRTCWVWLTHVLRHCELQRMTATDQRVVAPLVQGIWTCSPGTTVPEPISLANQDCSRSACPGTANRMAIEWRESPDRTT